MGDVLRFPDGEKMPDPDSAAALASNWLVSQFQNQMHEEAGRDYQIQVVPEGYRFVWPELTITVTNVE